VLLLHSLVVLTLSNVVAENVTDYIL
jgi:hypothetical protein